MRSTPEGASNSQATRDLNPGPPTPLHHTRRRSPHVLGSHGRGAPCSAELVACPAERAACPCTGILLRDITGLEPVARHLPGVLGGGCSSFELDAAPSASAKRPVVGFPAPRKRVFLLQAPSGRDGPGPEVCPDMTVEISGAGRAFEVVVGLTGNLTTTTVPVSRKPRKP